jgi:hypothetical protein
MANRKHKAYRLFSANISDFHFLFSGKRTSAEREGEIESQNGGKARKAEEMLIYGLSV